MKRKLKIGIVTDQLLAGGVQLAAIEQVKELNKLGHKAKLLILMRKKYPTDFSYLVKGIPYQFLSDSYPPFFRKTIKFPIFSFLSTLHLVSPILAPSVIKKDDYDILISLGTTTCLTTQAIYRKLKIPYVAVIHDPIVYILEKTYSNTFLKYFFPILKPIARYFEGSFVKDAKKTLIISRVHFSYIKRNYRISPTILAFGSKTLDKIPRKRGTTILSFGRWQKEKNPQFLLALAKETRAQFVIAGHWTSQKDYTELSSYIRREHLEKQVKLIPHFENEELEDLCKNARVFIHPHFEAFGLAALEAAGYGLPIMLPEKSGVTEQFTHGVHGFFPKKITVALYKTYVNRLLKNERLAYNMGYAAWKKVRAVYSWEANVKQLLNIIQSIVNDDAKTNVVFLANAFVEKSATGGGDQFLIELVRRKPKNMHIAIVTPRLASIHWEKARLPNLHIKYFYLPKNPFDNIDKPIPLFLAYCIRSIQTLILLPRIRPIHIIHTATDLIPDTIPAFFYHLFHPHIPWTARFFHFIEYPYKRPGKLWVNIGSFILQQISLLLLRRADLVMIDNPYLSYRLRSYGIDAKRIDTHPGGVDSKRIAETKPNKNFQSDAIFVGRLTPHKGIFEAVDIWRHVVKLRPSARLIMIGHGPDYITSALIQKIKQAKLGKNILLTGYIHDRNTIASYYQSSRLLLFLDHEAGFGLVIAEALSAGLPVVAYNLSIFGVSFKEGFLTAPIGDTSEVAKHIINLLSNSTLCNNLSQEARRESLRFDWLGTSKKFYNSLLRQKEIYF